MVENIINSFMTSYTYILPVGNQKDCWLVDYGDVEKVIEQGWNIRGVFLTHAHFDHIYGINKVLEAFPDAIFLGTIKQKCIKNTFKIARWGVKKY